LKKELDVVKNDIKDMIDKGLADTVNGVDDKLKNAVTEWSDKMKQQEAVNEKMQAQADELATAIKDYKEKAKKSNIISPYEYLKGELEKNEYFARYKQHRQSFDMQVNSAILKKDILVADDFTGDVIQPDRVTNTVSVRHSFFCTCNQHTQRGNCCRRCS